jgi:hypothetical protein
MTQFYYVMTVLLRDDTVLLRDDTVLLRDELRDDSFIT